MMNNAQATGAAVLSAIVFGTVAGLMIWADTANYLPTGLTTSVGILTMILAILCGGLAIACAVYSSKEGPEGWQGDANE